MTEIDRYSLCLSSSDWDRLGRWLRANPRVLFNDPSIRKEICKRRADAFAHEAEFTGDKSNMIDLTVAYNKAHQRERFLESHSSRLIWPLMAIDPVYEHAAELKVLSVGPRTTGEVLKLIAAGFTPENITAIDVVSNDPLIEIGDMHAMPYPNDTFDIVISGWTLPYSRNRKRALSEHVRVVKDGGLLAIGLTRVPKEHAEYPALVEQGSTIYDHTSHIQNDVDTTPGCVWAESVFSYAPPNAMTDHKNKGALLWIGHVWKRSRMVSEHMALIENRGWLSAKKTAG